MSIKEEQEATGRELTNDKCKSRIRYLLEDATQTSNIDNKYIEHIMFLSDSSDDEKSMKTTARKQDIPEIEDKLFLLSEKEIEAIDNLLLFEIKVFTKHIIKIKCGRSFSSCFNPEDHMTNVKYWIKKSIGFFRDQRIRENEDLEVEYVDDLEDYMLHCIKCYDEEVKSLSKSQSKHTDQSVPQQSANDNITNEESSQEEMDKNGIENAENHPINEQQVPKPNDGESTSHTDDSSTPLDGMNQDESPKNRQKVSGETGNDSNPEPINADLEKKASGENKSLEPITGDKENKDSQENESGFEKNQEPEVYPPTNDSTPAQESRKNDEEPDKLSVDDKHNEGQLDGTGDAKISESDLDLKLASGSHDVLIGGAPKDENRKPDDISHLLDNDSVDHDIMLIATQKYTPVECPEKEDRSV